MKKLASLITITTLTFSLSAGSFAAEKKTAVDKVAETTKKAADKTTETTKDAVEKVTGEPKAIPLYVEVTTIDAAGKSFTHKNKDGKEVKFVITDKTTIKNGEAVAKLEDIKVGDYVSGLRTKKSATEYEVVKITKFGAKTPKKEGEVKPAAAKPEEKKAN